MVTGGQMLEKGSLTHDCVVVRVTRSLWGELEGRENPLPFVILSEMLQR